MTITPKSEWGKKRNPAPKGAPRKNRMHSYATFNELT